MQISLVDLQNVLPMHRDMGGRGLGGEGLGRGGAI